MNLVQQFIATSTLQRLGWVLVHFIWQGAAVALLLAMLLLVFQRASSSARYILACAALLLLACLPPMTFAMLSQGLAAAAPGIINDSSWRQLPFISVATTTPLVKHPAQAAPISISAVVALAWIVGVTLQSIWRLGGWLLLRRLVAQAAPVEEALVSRARRIAASLNLSRSFRLLESARLQVPAVVGWIRPAILLHTSILSGLSVAELDAILAHELAHIRRHDYLLNLLQTLIETALFYHPAVWWVCAQIRQERENCCDDLALGVCGQRLIYANALARVEELRGWPAPLAMSLGGGSLLKRVRRVLGKPQPLFRPTPRSAMGALLALACLIAPLWGAKLWAQSQPASSQSAQATHSAADAKASMPTGIEPGDLLPVKKDYLIETGDTLSVQISDLNGPGQQTTKAIRVAEGGIISLPFIGLIKAAGLTAFELEGEISRGYKMANLISNAQIAVTITEAIGDRYSVLGNVQERGVFHLTSSDVRLLDVLALAKPEGEIGSIRVIRALPGGEKTRVLEIPADKLLAGDSRYNIFIHPRDFIRVEAAAPLSLRIEVGPNSLRYKGEETDWEKLSAVLEKIPAEQLNRTILVLIPRSQDMTLRQFNDALQRARNLSTIHNLHGVTSIDADTQLSDNDIVRVKQSATTQPTKQ